MNLIADCKQVRKMLPPYSSHELEASERWSVDEHLRGCAECRALMKEFSRVQDLARASFAPELLGESFNAETGRRLKAVTSGPQLRIEADAEEMPVRGGGFLDDLAERFGAAPWWIISGAFHALLLLLLTLIGMAILHHDAPETVIVTSLEKQQEPEPLKEPERAIFRQPVTVETSEVAEVQAPVVLHEEVEVADHDETVDEADSHDAYGDEGISDIPLGGSGYSGAIGVGGGGAGAFGRPTGGGQARLARALRGGGNKATESAVDAALAWLARHQEPDGHWDLKKYGGGKVIAGGHAFDPGITALAALAFLGAGHTTRVGKHKETLQRAVAWIIKQQRADGSFNAPQIHGYDIYDTTLCTLALAEAHAMSRAPNPETYEPKDGNKKETIASAAQKGIDYLMANQKEHGGWNHDHWESSSVLGWVVMALKSGKVAGLNVPPKGFEGALRRLEDIAEKDADGYWGMVGYTRKGEYIFTQGYTNTAIGMVCLQFMGLGGETENMARITASKPPQWSPGASHLGKPQDFYHWYYATLGLFQHGGAFWKDWNEGLKNTLLPNQHKGGPLDGSLQDLDGSWDFDSGFSPVGGRVYSTAMGALCLEVYYRYLPMYR